MFTTPFSFLNGFDPNAQVFINTVGITDQTQKIAINNLVIGLKVYNLWDKMQAIYPFIGSTATTQKWNLKSPFDTDASFRLTFSGGWTHASTGALPNGTNAYANTYLLGTTLSQNSVHLTYYSRSNTAQAGSAVDIGSIDGAGVILAMQIRSSANNINGVLNDKTGTVAANSDSSGFFIANRTASTVVNIWKNGVKQNTSAVASFSPSTIVQYLGAYNLNGTASNFSNREVAFASLGSGLTDAEAANFYTVVQAYQTELSRQV